MSKDELLIKINEWHEADEHQKIIDAIEALPQEERDYELVCLLARAYNNIADPNDPLLEKAMSLLESVREQGKDDPLWHFRMGYALFFLDRKDEALACFRRSLELDPNDETTQWFIGECENEFAADAVVYTEEEMDAVEKHINKYFGEFENVLHEIVSPDIHVDICVIPPSEGCDRYTLVTMGMGAYRMNVPQELEEYKLERAELAISLPSDWKLDEESLNDERWYWPIRLLKSTARIPVLNDTWLGWGHTVQMDDAEPYAENTELCACLLIDPKSADGGRVIGDLPGGEPLNFYQLIPLYQQELDYKIENGANALLERLSRVAGYAIDPSRPNAMSAMRPLPEDFIMDDVPWHMDKIRTLHFPIEEICAYNHLAIYLRWCMEHDLMSEEFLEKFSDEVQQLKTDPAQIDVRELLRDKLDGALVVKYFNDKGKGFAAYYYGENDAPCFPADIDNHALEYFGAERYNSDEFHDEAYLFVPFDEDYYQAMAKVIQMRWDAWQNIQGSTEPAEPSELAQAFMSYLDCECEYYPPMSDDDPIMAAYSYACRLAPREGLVPMLIAVDETLWECLIMNSDPKNDGAKGYRFDPMAVAAYRKKLLSQSLPDADEMFSKLIGICRQNARDDGMDWDEEIMGEQDGGIANDRLNGFWDCNSPKTLPLILAKIPVKDPWEVFAYLPFGNRNECPDTPSLMAAAKHWYERYGAAPAVMTHDVLEFTLPEPVGDEAAMELALQQYGLCPDAVCMSEDKLTVGCLADTLRQSKVWYLWWD